MRKEELEKILKALANRRRLSIVAYLKRVGKAKVGDIAFELQLSFAATSRHLVILERTGILDKEQRSTEVFYYLADLRNLFVMELIVEL